MPGYRMPGYQDTDPKKYKIEQERLQTGSTHELILNTVLSRSASILGLSFPCFFDSFFKCVELFLCDGALI